MAKTAPIMAPLHLVVANLGIQSGRCGRDDILKGNLLGSDNGRKRVVTTDTDTHHHTPEDDQTDNRNGRGVGGKSLSEGGEDDEDQLKAVHSLATDDVCEPTETELTEAAMVAASLRAGAAVTHATHALTD